MKPKSCTSLASASIESWNICHVFRSEENPEKRVILFLLNERVVRIPGCPQDTDLCPIEIFENIFEESIKRCEFEKWCKNEEYKPKYAEFLRQLKAKKVAESSMSSSYPDSSDK